MKSKITAIFMSLLMIIVIVPSSMASSQSIKLCEKQINTGGSWGICVPTDITKAQGTFSYNNVGTTLVFSASATRLTSTNGTSFSLIYYKDTDAAHVLATTKAVNVLATTTISGGSVSFSGNINTGNIPAGDDINLRGKIWIVPTSRINSDLTINWNGYANDATLEDMLYESDLTTVGATVQDRMGGIVYTASILDSEAEIIGSVTVLQYLPATVGIGATDVSFGSLYQGRSGTGTSTITVIETAGTDGFKPIEVTLSVTAGTWNNVGIVTIVNSVIPEVVTVNSATPVISTATLTVNVGANVEAGAHTQTITVNAVY
jgi:hypothetical protein